MTTALLVLGFLTALNPMRAAAAAPARDRPGIGLGTATATLAGITLAAALADPVLDLVGVTGASARIAAGIAMLAVALKDIAVAPPAPEPAFSGRLAALVPLAFPVLFTPAVALLAIAGSADRGVALVVSSSLPGLAAVVGAVVVGGALGRRRAVALGGTAAAAVAAVTTLDGVYAI